MAAGESLLVLGVEGIGEISPGDDLAAIIAAKAPLVAGDVVVVTQKIVSKAEGRMVRVDTSDPDAKRLLAESESVRVLRRRGDLVVTETRHGFVCANSGVDLSNVAEGWAALLPEDPDRSARRLRDGLRARTGLEVAVVISDTFGRAWRRGSPTLPSAAPESAPWSIFADDRRPRPRARRDGDLRRGRDRRRGRPRDGKGTGRSRRCGEGSGPFNARTRVRHRRGGPAIWRGPFPMTARRDGAGSALVAGAAHPGSC